MRLTSLSGAAAVAALAVTGWLAVPGGRAASIDNTSGTSAAGTVDVGVAGSVSASALGALTQAAALTHTSPDQLAADLVFQGWAGDGMPGARVPGTVDVGVAGSVSASALGALTQAAALTHTSADQLAVDLVFQGWR